MQLSKTYFALLFEVYKIIDLNLHIIQHPE